MRLLYIPLSGTGKDDLYKAFAKHCEVLDFWEGFKGDYDVIYVHSGAISKNSLLEIKQNAKVIQWTGDCRHEQLEPVMRYKGIADVTLLASGQKELYKELGRVEWLPHGVGEWQFREPKEVEFKIVFIGNNLSHLPGGKERADILREVEKNYPLEIYGSGWDEFRSNRHPIAVQDTPDIYNNSYLSLCGNVINDVPKYFSNRPLFAMAGGCCHLMREVPGLNTVINGDFFYHDVESLFKKIEKFKNSPVLRLATARQQSLIVRRFSYDRIAKQILEYVKN